MFTLNSDEPTVLVQRYFPSSLAGVPSPLHKVDSLLESELTYGDSEWWSLLSNSVKQKLEQFYLLSNLPLFVCTQAISTGPNG